MTVHRLFKKSILEGIISAGVIVSLVFIIAEYSQLCSFACCGFYYYYPVGNGLYGMVIHIIYIPAIAAATRYRCLLTIFYIACGRGLCQLVKAGAGNYLGRYISFFAVYRNGSFVKGNIPAGICGGNYLPFIYIKVYHLLCCSQVIYCFYVLRFSMQESC